MSRRALLALALTSALTIPASADAARGCDEVRATGGKWTVTAKHVRCRFAERWTREVVGHRRSEPTGWRCHFSFTDRYGGGGCFRGTDRKRRWRFERVGSDDYGRR